ncbi:MAG: methanesulfonate monooxygenase [Polynucleobacter sp.]|jgi:methanesulfonate monooxygenase small subunit|nr:methanesulfonate monooxygenase [Polynucleobacter sp.]
MDSREIACDVIYSSLLALDDKNFNGFLGLCHPEFHYKIGAYSPEIRKQMIWLEEDHDSMKRLFDSLPKHNSDHSTLARMGSIYSAHKQSNGDWKAVTFLQVFKTNLDGGATELFAVGKMHDTLRLDQDQLKILDREIKLETRMFGFGHHIPF